MNTSPLTPHPSPLPPLPPLVVILGPTAVGKTELSLQLCEHFHGEIVNADSRQIYQFMDIGTAKPSAEEQRRVPHHLIDLCPPDVVLSVAEYQARAYAVIDALHQRGSLPFLVGGTALYLRAVVEGLRIPEVPPNPTMRAELETQLAEGGVDSLFARLQQLDPATAAVIDRHNPRRLVRALEIVITTGRSKVELEGADPPPYRILLIGLERDRQSLYRRVDQRVESMMAAGWVEETARLLAMGFSAKLPSMTSLGYREITAYLQGEMSLNDAIERSKLETHRFVRHQATSFRKMAGIHWFDLETTSFQVITETVQHFLAASSTP